MFSMPLPTSSAFRPIPHTEGRAYLSEWLYDQIWMPPFQSPFALTYQKKILTSAEGAVGLLLQDSASF